MSNQAERYTTTLRNLLSIFLDASFQLPLVAVVVLGTWGYANGWVTIGQITTAAIYVQLLVDPLDRLIQVADRLQIGLAATTRLLGIVDVPQDRVPGEARPADQHLVGHDLRFAYREGRDVLHGVDLDLRSGKSAGGGSRPGRASRRWPAAGRHQRPRTWVRSRSAGATGRIPPLELLRNRGGAGHARAPRVRRHRATKTSCCAISS